ncbi:MAG: hypothetical protein ABTA24_16590, partial [Arthrobacter sp.]
QAYAAVSAGDEDTAAGLGLGIVLHKKSLRFGGGAFESDPIGAGGNYKFTGSSETMGESVWRVMTQ